jgi:hypothetical protein
VITRSRLACIAVAACWVLLSLLPWWQLRGAYSDASGTETTRIFSADVWRSSTPAALAVVIAAIVSVVLVATRGHPPQTPEQRGTGLVIVYLPVALLGWAAWSIGRLTAAPHRVIATWHELTPADLTPPDPHVVRDSLEILTYPGHAEGPAWGLYVGVALVLAVTAWATVQLLRPPTH